MLPEEYSDFTKELERRLLADPRVLGLIAVGSMAQVDYQPDQWSDHDFFVVVQPGTQEHFRTDLSWLPSNERIVFSYRETAHGLKVVYDNGHLLEFAVFDSHELHLAKVNRARVLLDRDQIQQHLQQIQAVTREWSHAAAQDDTYLFGQFLTGLLVAYWRYQRGEKISGRSFLVSQALRHLIPILEKYVESPQTSLLDSIDPLRRFEYVYRQLGEELNRILDQDLPQATKDLLALACRELKDRFPHFPAKAAEVIAEQLK